jgi:hypothetical protein
LEDFEELLFFTPLADFYWDLFSFELLFWEDFMLTSKLFLLLSVFGETEPFWDFPFLPLGDFEPF